MIQWLNKSLSEAQRGGIVSHNVASSAAKPPYGFRPSYGTVEQISGTKSVVSPYYGSRYTSSYTRQYTVGGTGSLTNTGKKFGGEDPLMQHMTATMPSAGQEPMAGGRPFSTYAAPVLRQEPAENAPEEPRSAPAPTAAEQRNEAGEVLLPVRYTQPN